MRAAFCAHFRCLNLDFRTDFPSYRRLKKKDVTSAFCFFFFQGHVALKVPLVFLL